MGPEMWHILNQPIGASQYSHGLFRLTDGHKWVPVAGILETLDIYALSEVGAYLYAGTSAGVFRSTDHGASWEGANIGLPDNAVVTALTMSPDDYLILGLESGGLYRTTEAVAVSEEAEPPSTASLTFASPYPNPFANSTAFSFELNTASLVSIYVYDVLGRKVATVAEGPYAAGTHRVMWSPADLPNGLYIARLEANGVTLTRRIVLSR